MIDIRNSNDIKYTIRELSSIKKDIVDLIETKLKRCGIMFRIFSRVKDINSLGKKINTNSAYGNGKKVQDILGIRVVLYFNDDINNVHKIISSEYSELSKDNSIDRIKNEEFKAIRYNIIYSIEDILNERNYKPNDYIDTTFELQIRSILSEGWHEVEHDLRYKCKSDWTGFDNDARRLNGVYATLETSEWTMINIFERLSYKHYKSGEIVPMFRQKFRLRFIDDQIDDRLLKILKEKNILKKFFRMDRNELILKLNEMDFWFPLTMSNLILFSNLFFIRNEEILDLTPNRFKQSFSNQEEKHNKQLELTLSLS